MILIAHRGNINGRIPELENSPEYIDAAIQLGYDVEIDVRLIGGKIFLGHDGPQYEISINWIVDRGKRLWIHCKNLDMLTFFNTLSYDINYFWHESDTVTLTSKNYIWAYPGKQPIKNSIAVIPELNLENIDNCLGTCSDVIEIYNKRFN